MKNIKNEAPKVVEAFRNLTNAIDEYSTVNKKTKELILLGIFTADKAAKGIETHTRLALENGATRQEIISAILYALPVVGIPSVTMALNNALKTIEEEKNIKQEKPKGLLRKHKKYIRVQWREVNEQN